MVDRRKALKAIGSVPIAAAAVGKVPSVAANSNNVSIDLWTSDSGSVSGYFMEPETTPAGAVLLIHEWWGLNDQIRNVVPKFAKAGFLSLAVDLYDGEVADTPDKAREIMSNVQPDTATEILIGWVDWLRKHPQGNGKVGTVGWCFGGGWSLNASLATPVDATVIYYGRCAKSTEEVASLKGPVMGHFATQDRFINKEMVEGFEKSMDAAGKTYTNFWYEADHGFANPTTTRHDAENTMVARDRTLEFFRQNLG